MKKLIAQVLLIVCLSTVALAGDIPGSTPLPPPLPTPIQIVVQILFGLVIP